jgi:26S proteasome regulatory subunit N12
MYYSLGISRGVDEEMRINVIALNLLFLLVQNRLADFHCELELLSDADRKHEYVVFCTQLDEHFTLGSYDSILRAASKPPNPSFNFFLNSLLETVRINIADCASSSYSTLTIQAATDMLMFKSTAESLNFISMYCKDEWVVNLKDNTINVKGQQQLKSEGIPSLRVISQSLTYATEMERIV